MTLYASCDAFIQLILSYGINFKKKKKSDTGWANYSELRTKLLKFQSCPTPYTHMTKQTDLLQITVKD